jgi:hypothetical protein
MDLNHIEACRVGPLGRTGEALNDALDLLRRER